MPILEKEYTVSLPMYSEAYDILKKDGNKNRRMFDIIRFWLCIAVGIGFIPIAMKDNENKYPYLAMFAFYGLAAVFWYTPKRIKREIMNVLAYTVGVVYRMSMFDDRIVISTVVSEEQKQQEKEEAIANGDEYEEEEAVEPTYLYFKNLTVIEKETFFIAYEAETNFYVIPKGKFTEAELVTFRGKCV